MEAIKAVIDKAIECFQVQLNFGSISFTLWQFYIATLLLSLTIWVIRHIFES